MEGGVAQIGGRAVTHIQLAVAPLGTGPMDIGQRVEMCGRILVIPKGPSYCSEPTIFSSICLRSLMTSR